VRASVCSCTVSCGTGELSFQFVAHAPAMHAASGSLPTVTICTESMKRCSAWMVSDLPELRGIDLATLGGRLQTVAKEVAAGAHPFDVSSGGDASANARFKTLIHGDPKAANLFIRDGSGSTEVGLIDFQWSGWGLAATDVAHHICAAVAPDALVDADSLDQSSLLSHYHTELCHALTDFGVVSSAEEADATLLSRELLQAQYEVALLDMCRLVFGYQWSRFKLSDTPESLNRNSYNKDLRNAAWLVQKCDELLTKRESV